LPFEGFRRSSARRIAHFSCSPAAPLVGSLFSQSHPPRFSPDRSLLSFSTACVLVDCQEQVFTCDFAYSADKSLQGWPAKGWPFEGYAAAPRIARFIHSLAAPLAVSFISLSRPLRCSPHRSFVSLARRTRQVIDRISLTLLTNDLSVACKRLAF
jgi:hypothetical protein